MNCPSPSSSESNYPFTEWSVICLATHGTENQKKVALEALCRAYWLPLYTFLRCSGHGHETAEDRVQEFFLRMMDGRLLSKAQPEKGRFRTLLLSAMKNLDCDLRRMETSQKRGGNAQLLSLDDALTEESWQMDQAQGASPELVFDRVWAKTVILRASRRLQQHFEEDGKGMLFAELFPRISGDITGDTLASSATKLGMSEAAVKMATSRLRRHYAEAMRDEIQDTVSSPEDVQDELRNLMACFS